MSASGEEHRGLEELERRLRELELQLLGDPASEAPAAPPTAELRAVAPAPPTPPPAPEPRSTWAQPPPAEPAPPAEEAAEALLAEARVELDGLQAHLDELVGFRRRLEASTRELLADYEGLLERMGEAPPAVVEREFPAPEAAGPIAGRGSWSTTSPAPEHAAAPHVPPAAPAAAAAPPLAAAPPPPQPSGPEQVVLDGAVVVDAGPFADIATLSAFEQALGHVAEVTDVYVRGFAGDRAVIDVILDGPVALGAAVALVSPVRCRAVAADATTLTVALGAG